MIKVRQVSKSFDRIEAVKDISLNIREGLPHSDVE